MFEQGEIVVVPFPFSDLSSVKNRPVLILSKNKDIIDSDDIITCGITSNLKNTRYFLLIENSNLENGAIPIKSRIKVDKLFTVDKNIIRKKGAKINYQTLNKVKMEFNSLV